ncbi:HAMP domain-containing sensor histidine kinase [Kibdelosporangium lantanae]
MAGRNRRGLLVRLLVVSVVVALCSIAATAWLAAKTTTVAINQQQSQALADDVKIYDTLVGYAAAHHDWSAVGPVVQDLAKRTGRRIELSTPDRRLIVGTDPLPDKASAVVDPLSTDPALARDATTDRIDERAVGPFRLSPDEKAALDATAKEVLKCVQGRSGSGSLVDTPSGRPKILTTAPATLSSCDQSGALGLPTGTERAALDQLRTLTNACLADRRLGPVTVNLDGTWKYAASQAVSPGPAPSTEPVDACLATARKQQLTPYVAAPALLFVTSPSQAYAGLDLSAANRARIIGVAALVLLVTVLATVFAGVRLVRPLRALTGAAQRMKDGDDTARVRVRGNDEIAGLAAAFNEMADSRAQVERQRKAMVSDIAHELRTPLSNIRGWLEAVEDGVTRPDRAFVASMMEEALLLQHIVDDLQDLAMADAGKLRVHPERIRLADVLTQQDPRLTVRVHGDPELDADPVRLRQVVTNLVTNALRHTPPDGSVTVDGLQDGDWVVVDVTDTGVGISPEDLPKVFDRFWRAEKSRSRGSGGSGLGLAIVKQLVAAHGGTVTARSVLGQGSTFTVRLPTTS